MNYYAKFKFISMTFFKFYYEERCTVVHLPLSRMKITN